MGPLVQMEENPKLDLSIFNEGRLKGGVIFEKIDIVNNQSVPDRFQSL